MAMTDRSDSLTEREKLAATIADAIQEQGRKASSGEPLFFDRFNLERVIRAALVSPERQPPTTVQQAADAIRKWLVQSFRYTASTIELNEVLVREISHVVQTERQPDAPPTARPFSDSGARLPDSERGSATGEAVTSVPSVGDSGRQAKLVAGDAVPDERPEPSDDVGPPGCWICRTCGFTLMKMKLRASDMAVGVDASVVEDICPNDGSSMRPKTWKEDALDSDRVGREQMQIASAYRTALESIANNSCCGGCQEAALVARVALQSSTASLVGELKK